MSSPPIRITWWHRLLLRYWRWRVKHGGTPIAQRELGRFEHMESLEHLIEKQARQVERLRRQIDERDEVGMLGRMARERDSVGRTGQIVDVAYPLVEKPISEMTHEEIKQAYAAIRVKILFLSPFVGENEEEWFSISGVWLL